MCTLNYLSTSHDVMKAAKAAERDAPHGPQSKVITLLAKYFFNRDNGVKKSSPRNRPILFLHCNTPTIYLSF